MKTYIGIVCILIAIIGSFRQVKCDTGGIFYVTQVWVTNESGQAVSFVGFESTINLYGRYPGQTDDYSVTYATRGASGYTDVNGFGSVTIQIPNPTDNIILTVVSFGCSLQDNIVISSSYTNIVQSFSGSYVFAPQFVVHAYPFRPEMSYYPRLLYTSSNVQSLKNRWTNANAITGTAPYDELKRKILELSEKPLVTNILPPGSSTEALESELIKSANNANIAKAAAFRYAMDPSSNNIPYAEKAKYALANIYYYTDASVLRWEPVYNWFIRTFIVDRYPVPHLYLHHQSQWMAHALTSYSEAFDILKGASYSFDEWVAGSKINRLAANLKSIMEEFRTGHYVLQLFGVPTALPGGNLFIKATTAVGLAGLLLNKTPDATDNVAYGAKAGWSEIVLASGGSGNKWIEGPAYYDYTFINAFPFFRAWNILNNGQGYTFPDDSYFAPDFVNTNIIKNLADWNLKIRMPNGKRPNIHDAAWSRGFNGGFFINSLANSDPSFMQRNGWSWYKNQAEPFAQKGDDSHAEGVIYDPDASHIPNDTAGVSMAVELFTGIDTNVGNPSLKDNYQPIMNSLPPTIFSQEGGYAVLRSRWDDYNARYMYIAAQSSEAEAATAKSHGQCDNTSFSIFGFGEWLAIDGGYGGSYPDNLNYSTLSLEPDVLSAKWLLKLPTAHNCVLIDGYGPALNTAATLPPTYFSTATFDYCEVATNYQNTNLTRSFLFLNKEYFVVIDKLNGLSQKNFKTLLHLNTGGGGGIQQLYIGGGNPNVTAKPLFSNYTPQPSWGNNLLSGSVTTVGLPTSANSQILAFGMTATLTQGSLYFGTSIDVNAWTNGRFNAHSTLFLGKNPGSSSATSTSFVSVLIPKQAGTTVPTFSRLSSLNDVAAIEINFVNPNRRAVVVANSNSTAISVSSGTFGSVIGIGEIVFIDTDNLLFGKAAMLIQRNGITYFQSPTLMNITLKETYDETNGWASQTGQTITVYTQDKKKYFSGCTLISYSNGYSTIRTTQNSFRLWGHGPVED
jgi:hypothetical protein